MELLRCYINYFERIVVNIFSKLRNSWFFPNYRSTIFFLKLWERKACTTSRKSILRTVRGERHWKRTDGRLKINNPPPLSFSHPFLLYILSFSEISANSWRPCLRGLQKSSSAILKRQFVPGNWKFRVFETYGVSWKLLSIRLILPSFFFNFFQKFTQSLLYLLFFFILIEGFS